MNIKLYIMVTGWITLDRSTLVAERNPGEKIKVPVITYLVRAGETNVLVDTGLAPLGATDPEAAWGKIGRQLQCELHPGQDVVSQLATLELSPDDIHVVINSHMHLDHTGANCLFPKATFCVQREEYRFALYPNRFHGASYLQNHFYSSEAHYTLLDGDSDVAPGVSVIFTPGHTIGHQSTLVELNSGPVILAGDAANLQRNLDHQLPPGHCWNQAEAIHSLARLRHLGRLLKARVWPGHDPDWVATVRLAPDFYE